MIVFDTVLPPATHDMAEAAGLLDILQTPRLVGIHQASDLSQYLVLGYATLKRNPRFFKKLLPDSESGLYTWFTIVVHDYLQACIYFPTAEVVVYECE